MKEDQDLLLLRLHEHTSTRLHDCTKKITNNKFSLASTDETLDHLETLYSSGSLKDEKIFKELRNLIIRLGKEINSFIIALENKHNIF
ncbi:MAG: hypothetical protein RQ761_03255 [Bacteroidales bacterium]|nr:hypothetical protein [Bacteroidales bacterium]